MLSRDETWEVVRCALSLPLSEEQIEWLLTDRKRAVLFDEILRGLAR